MGKTNNDCFPSLASWECSPLLHFMYFLSRNDTESKLSHRLYVWKY